MKSSTILALALAGNISVSTHAGEKTTHSDTRSIICYVSAGVASLISGGIGYQLGRRRKIKQEDNNDSSVILQKGITQEGLKKQKDMATKITIS